MQRTHPLGHTMKLQIPQVPADWRAGWGLWTGRHQGEAAEGLNKNPEQRVHCGRTDPGETCDSPGEERV